MSVSPLLSVERICKSYAVPVLKEVCFEIYAGEVHALLGENGAGKSTLSKIISGVIEPTSGSLSLNGKVYAPASRIDAEQAGVRMVMQELNLIPTLSIAENLFLNHLPHAFGFIGVDKLCAQAREMLARVGLESVDPKTLVSSLSLGQQQLVEIARQLVDGCCVLILDEPTDILTDHEADILYEQVQKLRACEVGIIFISHRLDEVRRFSQRATILRDGVVVDSRSLAELDNETVISKMVGRKIVENGGLFTPDYIQPVVEVRHLCCEPQVRDVSFTVNAGEILGFAGLVGSGRSALLRLLFGAEQKESGAVYLQGNEQAVEINNPRQAIENGLALVPKNRKTEGLLLDKSITLNSSLAALGKLSHYGWVDTKTERAQTEQLCARLSVAAVSLEQVVGELSGGNQQKVLLTRWLRTHCRVLLLDEPTRGVDVGAREEIYAVLQELCEQGVGIVMVSSDLRELMQVCQRIAVMSNGCLVDTFERGGWTEEGIMSAAFSGYV